MRYQHIVFMQGSEDVSECEQLWRDNYGDTIEGIEALVNHLSQWDYGTENCEPIIDEETWRRDQGSQTKVYCSGEYVLIRHYNGMYYGLYRVFD